MTNELLSTIKPQAIWQHFMALNAVPRPSKKEERVIAFMKSFGERHNLETLVDAIGNVIIKKPATTGMEDRRAVVLQSHLDMVHQKNDNTDFDFDNQGIEMYVDEGWVRARGTTLGADNGLGVAAMMAVLSADDLAHPDLEALFTIDEETGMTGAMKLSPATLNGRILLNLDTEEDDEIGIGCAGGVDVTATKSYSPEISPAGSECFQISVSGLQGGHSGMDIHRGLGNANKILNRFLSGLVLEHGVSLRSVDGGGLRNAIPREAKAVVVIPSNKHDDFTDYFSQLRNAIQTEYKSLEPNIKLELAPAEPVKEILPNAVAEALVHTLRAVNNGVYRMSPEFDNLVETSNNLAKVVAKEGQITVLCLTRSSVLSTRVDLASALQSVFESNGFSVEFSGEYPGWAPDMDSPILQTLTEKYVELFQSQPQVAACHAGLECGIIGQHYPDMDMISFGPTIRSAHSPDERAEIRSVEKFWKFLKAVLADIPKK
ncbi:MAG: aminoacyl-histidine dipeptidase [Leeuwenhoekiella sp.]